MVPSGLLKKLIQMTPCHSLFPSPLCRIGGQVPGGRSQHHLTDFHAVTAVLEDVHYPNTRRALVTDRFWAHCRADVIARKSD